MTPEIIAIVTVGVALAGVGVAIAEHDSYFDSRGAAGHHRITRRGQRIARRARGHFANAWRTWKG